MENNNKLYKVSGKCNYQQQYKAIIEAEMVSTPEGVTEKFQCHLANLWL